MVLIHPWINVTTDAKTFRSAWENREMQAHLRLSDHRWKRCWSPGEPGHINRRPAVAESQSKSTLSVTRPGHVTSRHRCRLGKFGHTRTGFPAPLKRSFPPQNTWKEGMRASVSRSNPPPRNLWRSGLNPQVKQEVNISGVFANVVTIAQIKRGIVFR